MKEIRGVNRGSVYSKVWTSTNGVKVPIESLKDDHLILIIRKLEAQYEVKRAERMREIDYKLSQLNDGDDDKAKRFMLTNDAKKLTVKRDSRVLFPILRDLYEEVGYRRLIVSDDVTFDGAYRIRIGEKVSWVQCMDLVVSDAPPWLAWSKGKHMWELALWIAKKGGTCVWTSVQRET